jgi:hypothetical protein
VVEIDFIQRVDRTACAASPDAKALAPENANIRAHRGDLRLFERARCPATHGTIRTGHEPESFLGWSVPRRHENLTYPTRAAPVMESVHAGQLRRMGARKANGPPETANRPGRRNDERGGAAVSCIDSGPTPRRFQRLRRHSRPPGARERFVLPLSTRHHAAPTSGLG